MQTTVERRYLDDGSFRGSSWPTALAEKESEKDLLAAAQAGNLHAFDRLVEPHREKMLRAARRILPFYEDAEDIVQDSVFRAFLRIGTFRGDARFSTWLTTIVTNSALSVLRQKGRYLTVLIDDLRDGQEDRPPLEICDTSPTPEQHYAQQELRNFLKSILSGLKPQYREMIKLRYLEEQSYKGIASLLGVAVPVVRGQLYWARQELRARVIGRRGSKSDAHYSSISQTPMQQNDASSTPENTHGGSTKRSQIEICRQRNRSHREAQTGENNSIMNKVAKRERKVRSRDTLLIESRSVDTRMSLMSTNYVQE